MAILASIEVDDEGSLKIRNFRDALSDLGASVVKSKQEMAQANASGAASAKQQVDALTQLTAAARAANAEQAKYGQGFSILSQQLKAGATVSQVQADALRQLAAQTQSNTQFTANYGAQLAALVKQVTAGAQVTPQLAQSLQQVANGHNQAAKGAQAHATATEKLRLDLAAAAAILELFGAELFGHLKSAAELAARIETLGVVLNRTAKNAGLSTFALQTQVQQVRALGVTTQEATDSVLQLVRANLDVKKTSELAAAAQNLAVAAGENSSQTMGRLITFIQSGNTQLLHQVGIVTTLDQIYANYGKTIGVHARLLNEQQKTQARLNEVLQRAEIEAGAYDEAMSTAGKQLTSFARYVEDSEAKLGQALIPTMGIAIKVATEFLKFWLSLNPAVAAAVTALASAAAAIAMFAGALAAAKFLGLIEVLETLIVVLNRLRLAVAYEGVAGGFALLAAEMNPVVAILTGLGVVIGVVTAAWVYFSSQQDLSIDNEAKAAAIAEGHIQTLEKQRTKIMDLAGSTLDAETKQKQYNTALQSILKTAPEAGNAIQGLAGDYVAINAEVDKAIAKQRELQRALLVGMQAKESALKQQMEAAAKQQIDLSTVAQNLVEKIAKVKAGEIVTEEVLGGATGVRKVTVDLATLEARFKDVTAAAAASVDPLKEVSGQWSRTHDQVESLRLSLPEFAEEARNANKALVSVELDKAREKFTNLEARVRSAGKSMKDLANAPDVPAFKAALADINSAWDVHIKKVEADAKKYATAFDSMVNKIRGTATVTAADFAAVNQELDKSQLSQEEYARRLNVAASVLNAFGNSAKATDPHLKNLRQGLDDLRSMNFEAVLQKWTDKFREMGDAAEDATKSGVRRLADDLDKITVTQNQKYIDMQVAQDDDLFQKRRELYERNVVAKMREVDQLIYQEDRRVQDILRGADKEKLARQKVVDEERRLVAERFDAAEREIDDTIRKARLKAQAEIQGIQTVRDYEAQNNAEKIRQNALAAQQAFDTLDQRLEHTRETAMLEVRARRDAQNEIIHGHQQAVDTMNTATDAMTAKQIADAQRAKREIVKTHSELRQALQTVFLSITQDFVSGLFDMIKGTKSFKDVVVGIFESIQNALLNVIKRMVQNWIEGLFKMKAASNAADAAGAIGGSTGSAGAGGQMRFGGLFGKGLSPAQKALGGAAFGMVAGGLVGSHVGGSRTAGALGGAASGAAAGFMFGGPIGAGLGALAGGIMGLFGANKERKQVQADRDQLIKDMGGLDAFKKKAQEAGFAYQQLLNTHSSKTFGSEVKKLQEALDQLNLKKTREELIKTSGGLGELSKKMQLVGFDSTRLFQTKSVTEYNSEVERLNKLLEDQQKRLEALGTASSGLDAAVKGMTMRLDRMLTDIVKKMSDSERKALEEAFKKATEAGFKGTQNDYLRQKELLPQAAMVKANPNLKPDAALAAFIEAQKVAQKEFNNLGLAATATFGAILQETGDITQAMNAIGPSLDQLIKLQDDWGLSAGEGFKKLLELRRVMTDNEDVVTSLSGITQIIKGLGAAGALTADVFNAMGNDAATMFQTLLDRGVSTDQALLLMQPTLQALWQAQKDFGFETDETTQKLIDQGVEHGIVGEKMQSINKQMLDVLLIIAKALGADIPSAYETSAAAAEANGRRTGEAMGGISGRVREVIDRAHEAKRAFEEFGDAAEEAGQRAEESSTGAAEGHSPTGIKQIIVRLHESIGAFKAFREAAVRDSSHVERAAASAAEQMQEINNLRDIYARAYAANNGYDPVRTDSSVRPPSAESSSTQHVTITVAPTVDINAEVKQSPKEAWEALDPVIRKAFSDNTNQIASDIEKFVANYRVRR